jgi:hypothetical protein
MSPSMLRLRRGPLERYQAITTSKFAFLTTAYLHLALLHPTHNYTKKEHIVKQCSALPSTASLLVSLERRFALPPLLLLTTEHDGSQSKS